MSFWSEIYQYRLPFYKHYPKKGYQVIGSIRSDLKSNSGYYIHLYEYDQIDAFVSYIDLSRYKWEKQLNKHFDFNIDHCYNVSSVTYKKEGEKPNINLSYKELNGKDVQKTAMEDYRYRQRLLDLFCNYASELFKIKKRIDYPNKKEFKLWEKEVADVPIIRQQLIDEYKNFLESILENTLWTISYSDHKTIIKKIKAGDVVFGNTDEEKKIFTGRLYHYFPDPEFEIQYEFKLITRSSDGYHRIKQLFDSILGKYRVIVADERIEMLLMLRNTPKYILIFKSKKEDLMIKTAIEIINEIQSNISQTEIFELKEFTSKNHQTGKINQLKPDGTYQLKEEDDESDSSEEEEEEETEEDKEDEED